MKPFALLITLCVYGGMTINPSHAQTNNTHVHFAKDQYLLSATTKSKLDSLVLSLRGKYQYTISLAGHTDSDGSDKYNRKLSANRVQTVYNYLISKGLDSSAIRKKSYGEHRPFMENKGETLMALNRRVEIMVRRKLIASDDTQEDSNTAPVVESNPCDRDTTVVLAGGTKITLGLCDFEKHRMAILNSKTIYTAREMMEYGLSLYTSDGQELVTGGMIKIANDSVVFDRPVEVELPLINDFFNCYDTAMLSRMRLYRANQHGDWDDSDTVSVVQRSTGTAFRFSISTGGTFNCDAIPTVPLRVIARAGGFLIAPIFQQIRKNQSTLRLKSPNGERIRKLQVTTSCGNCSQPSLVRRKYIRYNKKRTKAKIRFVECCSTDSLLVGYQIARDEDITVVDASELRKRGGSKLRPRCQREWGVLRRLSKETRRRIKDRGVNRKYILSV